MLVTKQEIADLKQICVVKKDCHVFFDKELQLVPGARARTEFWYNRYHAPASDVKTQKEVAGSLLFDEHPTKPFSRLTTKEQPTDYIGVGAIVYLKNCFNYGRVAKAFGYEAPIDDVISGKRNPWGEMKLHPLTITKMGYFSNYVEYTFTNNQGVSITLNESGNPEIVPCYMWEHEELRSSFYQAQGAHYREVLLRRQAEEAKRQELKDQFNSKCQKYFDAIKLGTRLLRGTDTYTVLDISVDPDFKRSIVKMKYFRGIISESIEKIVNGWYQIMD